jgi:hypothetical protein
MYSKQRLHTPFLATIRTFKHIDLVFEDIVKLVTISLSSVLISSYTNCELDLINVDDSINIITECVTISVKFHHEQHFTFNLSQFVSSDILIRYVELGTFIEM